MVNWVVGLFCCLIWRLDDDILLNEIWYVVVDGYCVDGCC